MGVLGDTNITLFGGNKVNNRFSKTIKPIQNIIPNDILQSCRIDGLSIESRKSKTMSWFTENPIIKEDITKVINKLEEGKKIYMI